MSSSLIGLDIGEKRIGVALADESVPFPSPLTTLEASPKLAEEFATILQKYKVRTVVIGYPRNQNGEPTAQTNRVQHIAKLLKIPDSINVIWQDESLTSVKAKEELDKRKKPYTKGEIDSLAATYILNDYVLTMQNSPKSSPTTEELSTNKITSNTGKTKKPKSYKKAKSTKSQKSSNIFKIILLVVLVPIVIFVSGVVWYVISLNPLTNTDQYKVVTIEQGASTSQIASALQDHSVIKSARAFTIYIRLNGVNNLQAGTYRLSSADPVAKIVKIISSGETTTDNLLISPGLRLDQIVRLLEKEGYKKSDIDSALDDVRDHPLLTNYPDNKRLEGYLYPDTYQVEPTTTAKQLIKSILDNFNDAITPKIKQGVKNQGLTLDQAIILASIVQKEVADPEVQKTVAQVFIKRFKEGNVLGSDVTYKYAAKQFGTPDNPDSNSPYNTRKFVGLPPTAISNFNLSALIAVSNPTNTDYNYFVAGDDGKTYFSNTLQQHNQNIADHCIKGCQ